MEANATEEFKTLGMENFLKDVCCKKERNRPIAGRIK